MQLAGLTIVLRPRTAWEAVDLGIALVRQHASVIWAAWILLTLPAVVIFTSIGLLIGHLWIGGLLMWWLKPVFDRIPLFVLSRAVFGAPPSLRETLRAQWQWGWRGIWPWFFWRRFHPSRAMLLPVDLLENLVGQPRQSRTRVLLRAVGMPSVMLTVICSNIEIMLTISIIVLGLMFVPVEFFSESTREMWTHLLIQPPLWAQCLSSFITWLAMSVIEPFYVGAGFGLYLNRRTQLEAWDIELAFRRMAARLAQAAAVLLFFSMMALSLSIPSIAVAADENVADNEPARDGMCVIDADELAKEIPDAVAGAAAKPELKPVLKPGLKDVFASQYHDDDAAFKSAVTEAYKDPDLNPKTTVDVWQRRHPLDEDKGDKTRPEWQRFIGRGVALLAQSLLWILAAFLLFLIIRYHQRWLPWISDSFDKKRSVDRIDSHAIAVPEQLPDDLPAAVRALWQQGKKRAALALFYRAAVNRLTLNLGTTLPPGATESECLRHARRLPDQTYAKLFLRIVRCWQAAAYAQKIPTDADVESLLGEWDQSRSATA